jgi:hypothetical protein
MPAQIETASVNTNTRTFTTIKAPNGSPHNGRTTRTASNATAGLALIPPAMTTPSALDGLATAERKITAEAHLRRNLGITDSARERVRTKLGDVEIEESPIKLRDQIPRGRRDEQVPQTINRKKVN